MKRDGPGGAARNEARRVTWLWLLIVASASFLMLLGDIVLRGGRGPSWLGLAVNAVILIAVLVMFIRIRRGSEDE